MHRKRITRCTPQTAAPFTFTTHVPERRRIVDIFEIDPLVGLPTGELVSLDCGATFFHVDGARLINERALPGGLLEVTTANHRSIVVRAADYLLVRYGPTRNPASLN